MRPDQLPGYWDRIIRRIEAQGPRAAAYAMAKRFHSVVSDETLVEYSHGKGTPTPSPPGGPPAIITGGLKRSMRLYPAVSTGPGKAKSHVQPLIVYARIQELGGIVVARHTYTDRHGKVRQGYLAWADAGHGKHFAHSVKIPARPYMRPTHRKVVADGSLTRAAADAVRGLVARG